METNDPSSGPLSRSSLEAYAFTLVELAVFVIPGWEAKAIGVFIAAALLVHIAFKSPWTFNFRFRMKVFIALLALCVSLSGGGYFTYEAWRGEHPLLPAAPAYQAGDNIDLEAASDASKCINVYASHTRGFETVRSLRVKGKNTSYCEFIKSGPNDWVYYNTARLIGAENLSRTTLFGPRFGYKFVYNSITTTFSFSVYIPPENSLENAEGVIIYVSSLYKSFEKRARAIDTQGNFNFPDEATPSKVVSVFSESEFPGNYPSYFRTVIQRNMGSGTLFFGPNGTY